MAKNISKRIPIKLGDFSVIDTAFSSIRDRFDSIMREMDEDMATFRTELMSREAKFFDSITSAADNLTSSALSPAKEPKQNYLSDFISPLIKEDGDNKALQLRFDVSQYAPEEIVVKAVDRKLLVFAKHEEESDTKAIYREYRREFLLPQGVNPDSIKSSLSKDGVLTIDAPLPLHLTTNEKVIPIAQE